MPPNLFWWKSKETLCFHNYPFFKTQLVHLNLDIPDQFTKAKHSERIKIIKQIQADILSLTQKYPCIQINSWLLNKQMTTYLKQIGFYEDNNVPSIIKWLKELEFYTMILWYYVSLRLTRKINNNTFKKMCSSKEIHIKIWRYVKQSQSN